jgi:disulfide oxidoreductase YuzD/ribosomal protein S18
MEQQLYYNPKFPENTTVQPVNVKIEYSYDYEKFKLVGINRKTIKQHIVAISEAILYRNLLHLFPIIVNKNWEVMDGQHRLSSVKHIQIAKMFNLPIYYIMDENVTLDDICMLNDNKINWKNIDYVNYYAAKGIKSYVILSKFMDEHNKIPLSTCIAITSSKQRDLAKLKRGELIIDKADKAHYVMACVYEIKERMLPTAQYWKSRDFITALNAIINTGKYQHHIMMASPKNCDTGWNIQLSKRAYVHEMQEIYNAGRTPAEWVGFMKLVSGEI